jgi:hypothetical protein
MGLHRRLVTQGQLSTSAVGYASSDSQDNRIVYCRSNTPCLRQGIKIYDLSMLARNKLNYDINTDLIFDPHDLDARKACVQSCSTIKMTRLISSGKSES